jgi:hypothetical protein
MQRTLRIRSTHLNYLSLALVTCVLIGACASKPESQWKGDNGGYGGTGRFNPVGSDAGASNPSDGSSSSNR